MLPNRTSTLVILLAGIPLLAPLNRAHGRTVSLAFTIEHRASERAFQFDQLVHATPAGTPFRITRLSYLLSEPRLQRTDGTWIDFANTYALVNAHKAPGQLILEKVPEGTYQNIEWKLGVGPASNHKEPGTWSADHPMNPAVNNLHWTWQEGYIFLALEGRFRNPKGEQPGFIYHVAKAEQLRTVTLPCRMELVDDTAATVHFRVPDLFAKLDMVRDSSSTHSREKDGLASLLADQAAQAFSLKENRAGTVQASKHRKGAVYPPGTTPIALALPARFPQPSLPRDNPLTEEGIALGEKLFLDTALSRGKTQSCASCHRPEVAFSDAGRAFSLGAAGAPGKMNTMALFNLAWHDGFFWDGRAKTLREQVLHPIQDPLEMNERLEKVQAKLDTPAYRASFARAFGSPGVTVERMALALEQYLLSLLSFDSKFDRAMAQTETYSPEEQRGFQLFLMEHDPNRGFKGADCFHCHGGYLFSNHRYFNNGLDADPVPGRSAVTGEAGDRGKFKAPSLRNIALTAPYMHDGRFKTLEEVIEHYDHGVHRSPTLDPNLAKHPPEGLGLTGAEKAALVAFLKTLTDETLGRSK
jgi:cytochrome c peroxidase